jgi:serine/threonine-protein kinase
MPLTIGTRLGSYELTALLGKGGMGEVYRARDAKLKREVAIKILPEEFSRNGERVSRFQREAEVLASLNHPNIAAIYDLQEAHDSRFLILELVEGETLAERIQRGPVPVEEALKIAHSICEALEAAHERGIIHRDLKPGNVKITPDGKVKVLDFGLAKALDTVPGSGSLSNSPTLTIAGTQAGVILGTAAYMSPEQAKGLNTDPRSDIFSFGAVLYEMLTGRQAFPGDNVSEILASILAREPDYALMPSKLSPQIERLLRRCLEKNPKRRWYAVGDVRVEVETALSDPRGLFVRDELPTISPKPVWKRSISVLLAVILAVLITSAVMWYSRPSPKLIVTRFPITLGEGQMFTLVARRALAISPDGTQIVYIANQRLYRRSMWELDAKPLSGGESPGYVLTDPVFSPDGQWIAFHSFGDRSLKKIPITGGTAVSLCSLDPPAGVSWGPDGIVYGQYSKGIMRVSPDGGKPELLVSLKPGEVIHGPQVLPGGETVLFTLGTGPTQTADQWDKAQIVVQSLKSGFRKPLIEGGTDARYLSTGHLVFARGGALFAAPFDLRHLTVTGGQVPVLEGVRRMTTTGAAQFSVSSNGSLIYIGGPATGDQLTLTFLDRKGSAESLKLPLGTYSTPRVSPDGKSVAFGLDDGREPAIWIYELSGATSMRRLTVGGSNRYPVWTRDGKRIAFQSDREGDLGIFWQAADGSGTAERLTRANQGVAHVPDSWSRDDQKLSFTEAQGEKRTVHIFSLRDRKDAVFAEAPLPVSGSTFSPDEKWVAYTSGETGTPEVWVQPFQSTGTKRQVSRDGAFFPFWSFDGTELFFIRRTLDLAAVGVANRPNLNFSIPAALPLRFFVGSTVAPRNIDIMPDGKRFIAVVTADQATTTSAPQIQVVLNWFSELQERVPVK